MTRQEINKQLLQELQVLVDNYPDLRFLQLLYDCNIVLKDKDQFYEESIATLNRMLETKDKVFINK